MNSPDKMETWEAQNPELWKACMEGLPEGWQKFPLNEIWEAQAKRVREGLCQFCGKEAKCIDTLLGGIFCSPECRHNDMAFYVLVSGK